MPGDLYFNTLNKKQEELGEGQKEERLERVELQTMDGSQREKGRTEKHHMEEENT